MVTAWKSRYRRNALAPAVPVEEEPVSGIRLIHGGKEYFDLLRLLISTARESIYLQVYIFSDDETGRGIADLLLQAAQRNVKVYLLVDGYASQDLPDAFITRLKSGGVSIRLFEPVWRSKYFYVGRRLHHKVVVVDNRYSLVSGINISNRYNDVQDIPAWLDWAVYAEGKVAAQLSHVCRKRVLPSTLRSMQKDATDRYYDSQVEGLVTVRINDWVRRKREITNSYLSMFRHAGSRIIIMSPYFLPGRYFRKSMKRAAQRGVCIQLILAGPSDVMLSKYAERYMYRWLFRNNIEIYEYQKNILHGKMAVFDSQWATAGSYNVNNISAYASIELNLVIRDPGFVHMAEQELTGIIANDCVRITEEIYNRRTTLWTRFLQRSAYDIFRLLFFIFTFYFRQRESG